MKFAFFKVCLHLPLILSFKRKNFVFSILAETQPFDKDKNIG